MVHSTFHTTTRLHIKIAYVSLTTSRQSDCVKAMSLFEFLLHEWARMWKKNCIRTYTALKPTPMKPIVLPVFVDSPTLARPSTSNGVNSLPL